MKSTAIAAIALMLVGTNAHAVDYTNAVITGVGLSAADGNLRFTIDKDPNAIFLTTAYTGEQLKRVVALVLSAYHAQSPVVWIQSGESSSASTRHYTNLTNISVGAYAWD